jgi:cadmium resistance protein CadD (predicted permease)
MVTGIATATATTFDDNIYLAMFFSRTNHRFRPIQIIVGEFLGFSVLVLISLSGFLLGRLCESAWLGLLGLLPIAIGVNTLLAGSTGASGQVRPVCGRRQWAEEGGPPRPMTLGRALRDPRTHQVSAVSIANGGNNIAIYIPLFSSCSPGRLAVILLVCYAAIGLWCLNSWFLIRQPQIALWMSRVVARIAPFVLISLGLSILLRNGTPQAVVAALGATS